MTFAMRNAVIAAAVCTLAAPLYAADGILIVLQTTRAGKTDTNRIQIEKNRMRVEAADPAGRKTVVLFDSAAQVVRMVDDAAKTYNEMTKDEADRMGAQMAGAMTQMQQAMANLPPEQRAQAEAMMKARGGNPGGGAPAPRTEYKKAGTDKVGKWTCDKYEGFKAGQKTTEVCTVDPGVLGLSAADLEITKQLADFFSKMAPQNGDSMFRAGSGDATSFAGVPVRTVTLAPQQSVTEVTDVSRQSFQDSIFAVPADYTKQAFGGRGRGRQ